MTALHNSSFLLLPFQPRLPDWLGLVVTSRPEFDVKTPLQALNPFPLDTQSESNRADIRDAKRKTVGSRFAATFGSN